MVSTDVKVIQFLRNLSHFYAENGGNGLPRNTVGPAYLPCNITIIFFYFNISFQNVYRAPFSVLTFKRRIKSHLPLEGIVRSSPYSPRFQDKG